MNKKTSIWAWLAPAMVVYIIGFSLCAVYDLSINKAVYNPASLYGIFFECMGWLPAFLPSIWLLCVIVTQPQGLKFAVWQRIIAVPVLAAGCFLICFNSRKDFVKRGFLSPGLNARAAVLLLFAAALFIFMLLAAARLKNGASQKMFFFGICGAVMLVSTEAVIRILKAIWNRTRFDDMMAIGSFDNFTPWYRPFGNGGTSFPSGHTANAACILLLLVLCDLFPKMGKHRKLITALCWVYIAAMGFSRVVIGRHYVSDTLAGSAIIALLFFGLRRTPVYKRGLAKVTGGENTPDAQNA